MELMKKAANKLNYINDYLPEQMKTHKHKNSMLVVQVRGTQLLLIEAAKNDTCAIQKKEKQRNT